MSRVIVHLDADAFFASVEQAADPRLRGKPVAVGGEKRGIVASASYEARKFGVYTPMPTVRARKLCPKLIVVPGDFEKYEHFSRWMFSYAQDFTPDVEIGSIDEGYFDLTAVPKPPLSVAETIRSAIRQSLKISVSEGIASNKLVSQIASKLTKPAAFNQVPPGREKMFLHPLPNKWLPGIGPKTSTQLNSAGLALIQHIAATPVDMLSLVLGNQASTIHRFAHGIDDRPLVPLREPQKTFSQQETFHKDITDEEFAEATLKRMADNLFASVRADDRTIRTLTVRVRYNDMAEDQVSESLAEPTDLETDVYGRLCAMLKRAWKRRVSLRLVSLKLSSVYDGRFRTELPLEISVQRQEAQHKLALIIDQLRKERGHSVVLRGHDFRLRMAPTDLLCEARPAPSSSVRSRRRAPRCNGRYVPLRVHSHYSFLDSVLSPAAIVELAARNEAPAVAMTDFANLHGAVEFVQAAQNRGVKPILGAELKVGAKALLLYVESAGGYHNLCTLLSRHATRTSAEEDASVANQQRAEFRFDALSGLTDGLIAVTSDRRIAELFPGRAYQPATNEKLMSGLPVVAVASVHYARPDDRQRFDIVQSIRTLTLLKQEHPEKRLSGRFHFRTQCEMARGCEDHPEWLIHSLEIADRCKFEMPFGSPQFPAYVPLDGSSPKQFLRKLVMEGAQRRYKPSQLSNVMRQIDEELSIISDVGYEEYFLITWDILQECRRRNVDWITRGSAADSLVCYCLGISGVCPIRFDLYFRRFLNKERMSLNKLPDIDIDFPHDRKDDVVSIIFEKYGHQHCAVVGGFNTFQSRSAFAEVAKVLGVGERDVRKFTERFPWSFGSSFEATGFESSRVLELLQNSPECRDLPITEEPYKTALEMAQFLDGVPRYPKMHPCGVVVSRQPMHELTPTFIASKGYATTHFDMDAVEDIGLVKIDILAQGGLAAMRDVKEALLQRNIEVDLGRCTATEKTTGKLLLGDVNADEPWSDKNVWEMIASGNARAVHHIESPAMTSLSRMCNVRDIDGLVAIVSVIRPGAANEGKKLSFTRRYQGLEPVT